MPHEGIWSQHAKTLAAFKDFLRDLYETMTQCGHLVNSPNKQKLRHFTERNTKYEICINSATIPASLLPH